MDICIVGVISRLLETEYARYLGLPIRDLTYWY